MTHHVRIAANGQSVDLSTEKSRNDWRDLLVGAGIRKIAIEVPGLGVIEAEDARIIPDVLIRFKHSV